jgi:hypothetical protein
VISHLASGGGWTTTLTLLNTGSTPVQTAVNFFDNNGTPLQLPLTFPQNGNAPVTTASFKATVNAGAELLIQSTAPSGEPSQVGWAQILADGNLSSFAVFSQAASDSLQEAVVPTETRTPSAFLLSFDNTNNYLTGVALANISTQPATIPVIIRDDTGNVMLNNSLSLPGQGHTSFALTSNYPASAQRRGTIEFRTPSNGQISVLGLRFTPTGAFTTIPVATK